MKVFLTWVLTLLFAAIVLVGPAWGQAGRFVVPRSVPRSVPRPVGGHGPHIPHIIHPGGYHGGNSNSTADSDSRAEIAFIVIVVLVAVVLFTIGAVIRHAADLKTQSASAKRTEEDFCFFHQEYVGASTNQSASASQNPLPDLIHSPVRVASRAEDTEQLLEEQAPSDPVMAPAHLREWITSTFFAVQKSWEERDYTRLQALLLPELYQLHQTLIDSMKRHGVVNRIEDLEIERLELVHALYPGTAEGGEVTALITFQARVYFVDDRTLNYQRGSRALDSFQEFWVFQRHGESWLLKAIERSHISNRLSEESLV
jgi:predicted lipid-binding transport protein (Tim44 family)